MSSPGVAGSPGEWDRDEEEEEEGGIRTEGDRKNMAKGESVCQVM